MSLLDTASLIVTPNAYKEGKLYSVIPSDGSGDMSVVRATTATRVNSAGLVELVPYNLLTYSEQFDNAAWSKVGAVTVNSNVTAAPDGTNTADRLNAIGEANRIEQIIAATSGNISIFAKPDTSNILRIIVQSSFSAIIDLSNNSISFVFGAANTSNFMVENYANGFKRVSISFTNAAAAKRFSSDGSIFIWGAQLNEGSTALPYLKTETRLNIPRLDYSNGTCPSLLVEPQRTNLILQSSSFDSASWGKTASSVTANTTTSPNGVQDADTLTADGSFGLHALTQAGNSINGTTYTHSIYAKKNTNDFIQLFGTFSIYTTSTVYANFDLNLGVVGSVGAGTTASIQDIGNGWYRCTMTATATATTTGNFIAPCLVTSATSPRAETNSLSTSVFLWGAQLESGAYSTSYIPTTSASVTRNADVISKTGISSLIGQTEGTIYLENSFLSNDLTARYFTLSDGTNTKRIIFDATTTSNQIRMVVINSTIQAEIFYTLADITAFNKIAIKYKANDFALFVNGVLVGSDTSGTVPSGLNTIKFSNTDNGVPFYGKVKALALWPTALTNDELATLTTI